MKYEAKITLPFYKVIYSMLFMVIIILVRPISSYSEIISVLESSVALLAGVFIRSQDHCVTCVLQERPDNILNGFFILYNQNHF